MSGLALVDSAIFIGLIRAGIDPVRELVAYLPFATWATCGMVRLGVVRGMRRRLQRGHWKISSMPLSKRRPIAQFGQVASVLDRRGVVLPAADLVVAACARAIGAALLSSDQHFRQIPHLKVFSSLNELR